MPEPIVEKGKVISLTFNDKIIEIRDATPDELKNGTPENKFGSALQ